MFNLKDKVALITGASGGIGKEIARSLKTQGAILAVSGTSEEKLKNLAADLGGNIEIFPCNLRDKEQVAALPKDIEEKLGALDILVNNAGITKDGLAMRMSDDDWQEVIDINLTSSFILSRGVLRGMMKRRFGRIINISSVVGVSGNPGQANYVSSKAGVIGLTKSFAAEVATRGVTVNAVAPGFIETAMTEKLNEDQKNTIYAKIPAGKMGKPEDVASAVVYLASDESSYITGQTIHVNGGMLMV